MGWSMAFPDHNFLPFNSNSYLLVPPNHESELLETFKYSILVYLRRSPPVKYLNDPSFVDHLCYLCLVFVMLSRLFIDALWSLVGKGLTSWFLFVMFNFVLSLSHVVS